MILLKIKYIYLILCAFGIILPYSQLFPLLLNQSLSLNTAYDQLFSNRVTTLFVFDLLITATTFIIFAVYEGLKIKVKHLWIPITATFIVGASLGFPLFLYIREITIQKNLIKKEVSILEIV